MGHAASPTIDFNDLTGKGTWYTGFWGPIRAYGQAKTANILFAHKLNSILQSENLGYAFSVHPGGIITELQRHNVDVFQVVSVIGTPIWKTISQGSSTTLYAATMPEAVARANAGAYLSDCYFETPSANLTQADQLWQVTEDLITKVNEKRKKGKVV